jgi:hypothetical protein
MLAVDQSIWPWNEHNSSCPRKTKTDQTNWRHPSLWRAKLVHECYISLILIGVFSRRGCLFTWHRPVMVIAVAAVTHAACVVIITIRLMGIMMRAQPGKSDCFLYWRNIGELWRGGGWIGSMGVWEWHGLYLWNREFVFVRTTMGWGLRLRGSFRGMTCYTLQWARTVCLFRLPWTLLWQCGQWVTMVDCAFGGA